jgi:hypothetical protein
MNHRPFEDWLLAENPLTPQQERELTAHLQICPSCSSLAEVSLALRTVQQAGPPAGFVSRFQVRLAAQRQAMRRKHVAGFVVLAGSVVVLSIGLGWPTWEIAIHSPVDFIGSWLVSLTNLWASLQVLFHAATVLLRVAPGFVPAYLWGLVLFAFTG